MNYFCDEHYKAFSYFCFKCDKHFCLECKNIHIEHSFINLEETKISEEELNKEENLIKAKISSLFNKYSNEQLAHKSSEKIENFKEEIIEFNYFIINTYRINKNNFYNYFNFYYLFRLKNDLKNKDNNMLKQFFGIYGFKKIINDLKNYYKKKKIVWLIKNLVSYKKSKNEKEIYLRKIEKRKENYKFENLYLLLQNEGFEENIVNKMKEIIKEVKNKVNYKIKIFNFIIESVDAFKNDK